VRTSAHRAAKRLPPATPAGAGLAVTVAPASTDDIISTGDRSVLQHPCAGQGCCGWLGRSRFGTEWQGAPSLAPWTPLDRVFARWDPSTQGHGHTAARAVLDTSQQTPATIATRTRRCRTTVLICSPMHPPVQPR
jgi:hypothetical protein